MNILHIDFCHQSQGGECREVSEEWGSGPPPCGLLGAKHPHRKRSRGGNIQSWHSQSEFQWDFTKSCEAASSLPVLCSFWWSCWDRCCLICFPWASLHSSCNLVFVNKSRKFFITFDSLRKSWWKSSTTSYLQQSPPFLHHRAVIKWCSSLKER